jgi:hypothetical protein
MGLALSAVLVVLWTGNAYAWQMKQAPLMTQWARQIDTNAPLPEYPRPQMVRSNWLNLNGLWQFQAGVTNSDPVPTNQTLSSQILVPYHPSIVTWTDFNEGAGDFDTTGSIADTVKSWDPTLFGGL